MSELKRQFCSQHPDQTVDSICLTKGCDWRTLCLECHKVHNPHHQFTKWSIKQDLKQVSKTFASLLHSRLSQFFNTLEANLLKMMSAFCSALSKQASDWQYNVFLRYCNNDQMVVHCLKQFINDDYTMLDGPMFKKIMETLRKIEESEVLNRSSELNEYDLGMIDTIVLNFEKTLGVAERIYWEGSVLGPAKNLKPKQAYQSQFQMMVDLIQAEQINIKRLIETPKVKGNVVLNRINLGGVGTLSKAIERVKQTPITILSAAQCRISDLKPFATLKDSKLSVNLKKLYLNNNYIISLEDLSEIVFDSLDQLQLAHNKILSLWGLEKQKWPSLKILNLSNNLFTSLKPLQQFKMVELQQLVLDQNRNIESLFPIGRSNFPKMVRLSLCRTDVIDKTRIEDIYFEDERLRKKVWMSL